MDQAVSGLTGPVQGDCPDYPQLFLVYCTVAALHGALDLAILAAIEGSVEPRPLPLQALSQAATPPARPTAPTVPSVDPPPPAPAQPDLPPGMSLLELANDTARWTEE